MTRIGKEDLENALKTLNSVSKCKYRILGAYGRVQLVKEIQDGSGAVTPITGFHTKPELYDIIWSIVKYVQYEE
jgi:hypothetical protein